MTTGSRQSWRSTCRRPWERVRRKNPCLHRILALRRKKRRKNRGGDITPMRLRRSLFFVAPATPAGRPSLADPAGPAAVCPAPPSCPRLPRPRRVRPVEPSCTGCAGATGGRASAQAQGGRVLVANPVSAWPFGWPLVRKGRTTRNRRPDRCTRSPVNASLLTSARNCSELPGSFLLLACSRLRRFVGDCAQLCSMGGAVLLPLSKCPRTVRRSRSASRRAPLGAAPVALRACSAVANAK